MLAEMYGMIPSANTVARASWPPVNRLYRPSRPPPFFCESMKSAIACGLMPGAVTARADPVDQKAQQREKDLVLQLGGSEEILNRRRRVGLRHGNSLLLDAASGRDNLLASAGADLEPAHRDRLRNLAVRQHLHLTLVSRGSDPASASDSRVISRRGELARDRRDARPGSPRGTDW